MNRRAAAALALSFIVAAAAGAGAVAGGALHVDQAWSRPAPKGGTGAGFMRIVNHGAAEDRLVAVSSPIAARAELHETMIMGGRAMMHPRPEGLVIPAGATVDLKPGGRHVMFMGLKRTLRAGDRFPATLTFAKAGAVKVEFVVRTGAAASTATPHDH
ncbi:MAG: copper chaperone PCu(A)C [Pseudomonadota bacterium]